MTQEITLPPLPIHFDDYMDRGTKAEVQAHVRNAIEADRKRRGEPVAWQSIDTAPKDGSNILLTNGTDVTVGHWYHEEPYIREKRDIDGHYIGQDESDGYDDWVDWFGGIAPTHWMPLPPAPQPAEPVTIPETEASDNSEPVKVPNKSEGENYG